MQYCQEAWEISHGYKLFLPTKSEQIQSSLLLAQFAALPDMALTNATAINATMRAVVWQGNPYNVGVVDLPRPTIINQTDAIVQISRAAICGSDLHIYRGTNEGMPAPFGLGHEGVGYVSEVGAGVSSLSVGDPVIVPFTVDEGHLHTGLTTQMYGGYGNGGDLGGTQGTCLQKWSLRLA